jgi:hypothetical protein
LSSNKIQQACIILPDFDAARSMTDVLVSRAWAGLKNTRVLFVISALQALCLVKRKMTPLSFPRFLEILLIRGIQPDLSAAGRFLAGPAMAV